MNRIKNIQVTGALGRNISLDIFWVNSSSPHPVVIYAHGFNGFKDWGNFDLIAKVFAQAGFAFIKFNFSHNGTTAEAPEIFSDLEAFGNNNYSKQLEDLRLVTDWICNTSNPYNQLLAVNQISLIGHSMGGGMAILFAAEDSRIKKLITWAAVSECKTPWGSWTAEKMQTWKTEGVQYYTNSRTNQQMPLYYQLYLDYQENMERLDIQKAIQKLHIPMLICHGNNDIAVPAEAAVQLKSWQPEAELFLVEGNHVFDRLHPWILTVLPDATQEVVNKSISFLK